MRAFDDLVNTLNGLNMKEDIICIDFVPKGISVFMSDYKKLPGGCKFKPFDSKTYPWKAETFVKGVKFYALLGIDESYELYV